MQAVLATLGYVLSSDGNQVLLIRRDARSDDFHYGKYNGLGGKLEPYEDIYSGMRREIVEESGLDCIDMELAGTVSWPGFGRDGEAWFGFIFRIPHWSGTPARSNPEGSLVWIDISDVLAGKVPMWEGDRNFLPLVFSSGKQFHGVMPYAGGRPTAWSYTEA